MSDFPVANRREARKLGLLRSKSSEAERERLEPLERNERVCGEEPDTDAYPMVKDFGLLHGMRPRTKAKETAFRRTLFYLFSQHY